MHRHFLFPQLEYRFLKGIGLVSFFVFCITLLLSVWFDLGSFRMGVFSTPAGLKGCVLVQLLLEHASVRTNDLPFLPSSPMCCFDCMLLLSQ